MSRKIFISYKYGDTGVQHIPRVGDDDPTTARHYVDVLQAHLDVNDHINKGEADDEDLSNFKEETIESKLRDKIFDSSITVVIISKNMKESNLSEDDQWIPWEISYSLKETTRNDRTSSTNAILAVIIPDENGSYEYFIQPVGCLDCRSIRWKIESLFKVLGNNMFNRKEPKTKTCPNGVCGTLHTDNDHSYIHPIKWSDFIPNMNFYLDHVVSINQNIEDYNLLKTV